MPASSETRAAAAARGRKPGQSAPIFVVGMHRSGTSLATHLLQALGVYLGAAEKVGAVGPDNPDGFFEHADFLRLNTALLDHAAADWDLPPPAVTPAVVNGWLAEHEEAGRELLTVIRDGAPSGHRWALKDPRLCLTLPFWLRLAPDAEVLLCLRDPLAVAISLRRRNFLSLRYALHLCDQYLRNLEAAVARHPPRACVVMSELVTNPPEVAARLARQLRVAADAASLQRAAQLPEQHKVHHQKQLAQFRSWKDAYPELLPRYERLQALAAPARRE